MKGKIWFNLITAVVLLLGISLACGISEQAAEQLGEAAEAIKETALPLVATAAPALQLPTREPTSGEEISFEDALDQLSSYRLRLVIEVAGNDSGGEKHSMEIINEKIRAQSQIHSRVANGDGSGGGFELYGSNGETFIMQPDNLEKPCLLLSASAIIPFEIGLTSVDQIFKGLQKDQLIQAGEEVNGVKTDHYTGKGLSTLMGSLDSYEAEVWLAQYGEYPVRFTGEALGTIRLFDRETSGNIYWTYDLTDINQVVDIPLPSACEQARHVNEDLPVPWNASEKKIYGGVMTFTTPDDSKTVAEFYRSELPANGWTFEETVSTEMLYLMRISKVDRVMQLTISSVPTGGSLVVISDWNP